MPPPDCASINHSSIPSVNNNSIMQETAASSSSNNPHPPYLYPPLLQVNDSMSDNLSTPYASNQAEFFLVSLQPKSSSTKKQLLEASSITTAKADSRLKLNPNTATSQQSKQAGQEPDSHRPDNISTPTRPAVSALAQHPLHNDGFIKVKHKMKSQAPSNMADMQLLDLLFNRIGPKKELENIPIQFGTMLQALVSINPHIIIFPYNCNIEGTQKALALLKCPQDYKSLMDITLVNWGSPSNSKSKLAFLFYIGSTIIGDDLDALKKS